MILKIKPSFFVSITTYLLLSLGMLSCHKPSSIPETTPPTTPEEDKPTEPKVLELPEPTVGTPVRFKLTKLSTANHKALKLNDNIVFTGLEDTSTNGVSITVKSHCIISEKQVIIKEYKRRMTNKIPLIEILPKEVLLHKGVNLPSCGFSFKAKNQAGSAHHFELPQLPIENHLKTHALEIKKESKTHTDPFFNIFMKDIALYNLNKGVDNKISTLKLICDDFELPLDIFLNQQFVPLSAFPYDDLSQEIQDKVYKENPVQMCRILGYKALTAKEEENSARQKILEGVSTFFKLVFPIKPFIIHQKQHMQSDGETHAFFKLLSREYKWQTELNIKRINKKLDNKIDREPNLFYIVVIKNTRSYPVPFFIKTPEATVQNSSANSKTPSIKVIQGAGIINTYNMYYIENSNSSYNIYKASQAHYAVQVRSIKKGISITKTEEGEVILLNPSGELHLSILLKTAPDMCEHHIASQQVITTHKLHWLGFLFKYPELNIFELANQNITAMPLKWNIVQKLNTTSFPETTLLSWNTTSSLKDTNSPLDSHSFLIVPRKNLESINETSFPNYLWLLEGDCFMIPDYYEYDKPFISLEREPVHGSNKGIWGAHWMEGYELDRNIYSRAKTDVSRALSK